MPFFSPLQGLQWNLFLHGVHVNVSNNKDLQHERNNTKRSVSWRQLLEVGWKQHGEPVERPGCEESVNFSLSAPVFARFRLRRANGPNSHWLCVSVSAVEQRERELDLWFVAFIPSQTDLFRLRGAA